METNQLTTCPNCNKPIKSSILSSNELLNNDKVAIINEYHEKKSTAFCEKCGNKLYQEYRSRLISDKENLNIKMGSKLSCIPLASIHSPLNWEYDVLGLVTGQSVTGTGVFSEFASSFTDFFGKQSKAYNSKIKGGEYLCMSQIRKQTIDLGGNAIVAVDIDYSEVGGDKGMLMVCMTGTAIRLKNLDILGDNILSKMNELMTLNERFVHLNEIEIPYL